MNNLIYNSYKEYERFVEEFYPKTVFSCTHYRKLIGNLFTVVELADVYIDILNKTDFFDYISYIKHQFLLMLYHLPNYNSFFISSLQRGISETILRMNLVSVGHNIQDSNNMPFFRIQEKLKETGIYKNNENDFKTSCDALFSYFGNNSRAIHNSSTTKQNYMQYIMSFNLSITDQQVEQISKFIKVVIHYFLVVFSRYNNINDLTLGLASKIHLKKVIGTTEYENYFGVEI